MTSELFEIFLEAHHSSSFESHVIAKSLQMNICQIRINLHKNLCDAFLDFDQIEMLKACQGIRLEFQ